MTCLLRFDVEIYSRSVTFHDRLWGYTIGTKINDNVFHPLRAAFFWGGAFGVWGGLLEKSHLDRLRELEAPLGDAQLPCNSRATYFWTPNSGGGGVKMRDVLLVDNLWILTTGIAYLV